MSSMSGYSSFTHPDNVKETGGLREGREFGKDVSGNVWQSTKSRKAGKQQSGSGGVIQGSVWDKERSMDYTVHPRDGSSGGYQIPNVHPDNAKEGLSGDENFGMDKLFTTNKTNETIPKTTIPISTNSVSDRAFQSTVDKQVGNVSGDFGKRIEQGDEDTEWQTVGGKAPPEKDLSSIFDRLSEKVLGKKDIQGNEISSSGNSGKVWDSGIDTSSSISDNKSILSDKQQPKINKISQIRKSDQQRLGTGGKSFAQAVGSAPDTDKAKVADSNIYSALDEEGDDRIMDEESSGSSSGSILSKQNISGKVDSMKQSVSSISGTATSKLSALADSAKQSVSKLSDSVSGMISSSKLVGGGSSTIDNDKLEELADLSDKDDDAIQQHNKITKEIKSFKPKKLHHVDVDEQLGDEVGHVVDSSSSKSSLKDISTTDISNKLRGLADTAKLQASKLSDSVSGMINTGKQTVQQKMKSTNIGVGGGSGNGKTGDVKLQKMVNLKGKDQNVIQQHNKLNKEVKSFKIKKLHHVDVDEHSGAQLGHVVDSDVSSDITSNISNKLSGFADTAKLQASKLSDSVTGIIQTGKQTVQQKLKGSNVGGAKLDKIVNLKGKDQDVIQQHNKINKEVKSFKPKKLHHVDMDSGDVGDDSSSSGFSDTVQNVKSKASQLSSDAGVQLNDTWSKTKSVMYNVQDTVKDNFNNSWQYLDRISRSPALAPLVDNIGPTLRTYTRQYYTSLQNFILDMWANPPYNKILFNLIVFFNWLCPLLFLHTKEAYTVLFGSMVSLLGQHLIQMRTGMDSFSPLNRLANMIWLPIMFFLWSSNDMGVLGTASTSHGYLFHLWLRGLLMINTAMITIDISTLLHYFDQDASDIGFQPFTKVNLTIAPGTGNVLLVPNVDKTKRNQIQQLNGKKSVKEIPVKNQGAQTVTGGHNFKQEVKNLLFKGLDSSSLSSSSSGSGSTSTSQVQAEPVDDGDSLQITMKIPTSAIREAAKDQQLSESKLSKRSGGSGGDTSGRSLQSDIGNVSGGGGFDTSFDSSSSGNNNIFEDHDVDEYGQDFDKFDSFDNQQQSAGDFDQSSSFAPQQKKLKSSSFESSEDSQIRGRGKKHMI